MRLTVDLEDYSPDGGTPRSARVVSELLDVLDVLDVKATFFVVGQLAERIPDMVRRVVASGHEVGLHGYRHEMLVRLGPASVKDDLRRGREILENLAGGPPLGYRAPYFSVTRTTPWAPKAILESGFAYSSSVLPAWNPQAGLPGAPRRPFRWTCGLREIPVPTFGVANLRIPVLGGMYLRALPNFIVALCGRRARRSGSSFVYVHPYDFDADEPVERWAGQNRLTTWMLWSGRSRMLERVRPLLAPPTGPLCDLLDDADLWSDAPTFEVR